MCSLTLSGETLISLGLNASSNEFRFQINLKPIYLVQAIGKLLLLMELPPQWPGIGDIQVTSNLVLKNVLHVPQLSTNIVSIQKLTQDLSCHVIFDASFCEFQD